MEMPACEFIEFCNEIHALVVTYLFHGMVVTIGCERTYPHDSEPQALCHLCLADGIIAHRDLMGWQFIAVGVVHVWRSAHSERTALYLHHIELIAIYLYRLEILGYGDQHMFLFTVDNRVYQPTDPCYCQDSGKPHKQAMAEHRVLIERYLVFGLLFVLLDIQLFLLCQHLRRVHNGETPAQ